MVEDGLRTAGRPAEVGSGIAIAIVRAAGNARIRRTWDAPIPTPVTPGVSAILFAP